VSTLLIALVLFALLGWSGGHHWDEYFYLYSSFMHTPAELLRYELTTGIFPPGFFTEKIGHVVLLHVLTRLFGAGEQVLYGIEVLYALLLIGYFWSAYRLLEELFGSSEARDSTLVLMFSPVSLYLGYKLLSEVPSLLFVTLGIWQFVRSLSARRKRDRRVALALAIPMLAVGALFRITSVIGFVGLGVALLVRADPRFDRRLLLRNMTLACAGAGILFVLALASAGGDPFQIIGGIHTVVTTHPALERVFALACFVQTFALVLPFAWPEHDRQAVRISAVWLVCAALPFLAGHEARYYAPALIPFAVLSATGFRCAAAKLVAPAPRNAWLGFLAVFVLVNRVLLIPLMPYEVEQEQLLGLFHRLRERAPDATYLVPWISDYSLLRFSSPRSRIQLCLSVLPGGRISSTGHEGQLEPADQWWAGTDHYVGSEADLASQPRPWQYVGWTYNPAVLRLTDLFARLGLHLSNGAKLHNHLTGSWIWSDGSVLWKLSEHSGMYYVYQVTPRPL
jgi:hypothetical protein